MAEASANSLERRVLDGCIRSSTILFDYSVVVADDADIVDRVSDSFDVLSTLPDWYQYLLFLAVSASFGIRGADKLMKLRAK